MLKNLLMSNQSSFVKGTLGYVDLASKPHRSSRIMKPTSLSLMEHHSESYSSSNDSMSKPISLVRFRSFHGTRRSTPSSPIISENIVSGDLWSPKNIWPMLWGLGEIFTQKWHELYRGNNPISKESLINVPMCTRAILIGPQWWPKKISRILDQKDRLVEKVD